MSDEETQLMAKYGITAESKTIYHYQGHKYDRLKDALNYAEKAESDTRPATK